MQHIWGEVDSDCSVFPHGPCSPQIFRVGLGKNFPSYLVRVREAVPTLPTV